MPAKSMKELESEIITYEGAKNILENIDELDDTEHRHLLVFTLKNFTFNRPWTPANNWFGEGESDPHKEMYNEERARIAYGNMPDDTIANALFMGGDGYMKGVSTIALLTAGKERIRWLSRSLITVLKLLSVARGRLAKYENVDVTVPYTGDLNKFLDTEYKRYIGITYYVTPPTNNDTVKFDSSGEMPTGKRTLDFDSSLPVPPAKKGY